MNLLRQKYRSCHCSGIHRYKGHVIFNWLSLINSSTSQTALLLPECVQCEICWLDVNFQISGDLKPNAPPFSTQIPVVTLDGY